MLEIYLLEQLDAFKRHGTLRGAAESLHMSQPSLTRSMQKIESILDVPILERTGNRVALNPVGELVASYAEIILREESQLLKDVHTLKKGMNALSIGSIAPGPLFVLLPQATQACPELTISSNIACEEELINGLNSGEYHIILLDHRAEGSEYICTEYITEQLFLTIPPLHPASSKKSVSFADLDGQNFIVFSRIGIWHDIIKRRMPNSHFFEQASLEAVAELTRYSDLPSFVTDISLNTFASGSTRRLNIPFTGKDSRLTFHMICRRKDAAKWKKLMQI